MQASQYSMDLTPEIWHGSNTVLTLGYHIQYNSAEYTTEHNRKHSNVKRCRFFSMSLLGSVKWPFWFDKKIIIIGYLAKKSVESVIQIEKYWISIFLLFVNKNEEDTVI